jgi:hypothetical protein
MKVDWGFPKRVLLICAVLVVLGLYPLLTYGTPEIIAGVIAGSVLAILNVLFGYFSIEYAKGKSNTTFLKAVLGGMGIRLVVSLTAVLILVRVFDFHIVSLVSSFLILYFSFMFPLILMYHKKLSMRE